MGVAGKNLRNSSANRLATPTSPRGIAACRFSVEQQWMIAHAHLSAKKRFDACLMNSTAQQTEFLSWKVVPARLDATQAAWFLGFEPHEIPRLVTASLLKPLGHPARNSTKFFATETLEQFRRDEKWFARASDAIAISGGSATPSKRSLCAKEDVHYQR